ncbi:hypothetical protein [Microbacterium sp. SORGH_AS_0862]|uniref:hypothetical protein n=1 Tax=Microbacterium sp. SORGH_AS_0862 TaxID=3041789 RepID=UPI00278E273B|nr:hypothetical protein [Microbacterium sp. SORGH_AS_0862]MDQ1206181.1 hypothetical protein [Microbacterium sp. SORGH_AS_0862]
MSAGERQPQVDAEARNGAVEPTDKRNARSDIETESWLNGFVRRIIRRAGVRVANADEVELSILLAIRDDFDDAIQTAVDGMRDRHVPWRLIGEAAGITTQAAQQRWGRDQKETTR